VPRPRKPRPTVGRNAPTRRGPAGYENKRTSDQPGPDEVKQARGRGQLGKGSEDGDKNTGRRLVSRVNPNLKKQVAGSLLERSQSRQRRLGLDVTSNITRGQAQGLRGRVRRQQFDRAGDPTAGGKIKGADEAKGETQSSDVKDRVTGEIAKRARGRAKRLGLEPLTGPVSKSQARSMLSQMRQARGVTVNKKGEKNFDTSQPAGRAENLRSLGIKDVNKTTTGQEGFARSGREYEVEWDPLKERYVHTYGKTKDKPEKRVYLGPKHAWVTDVYGKKPYEAKKSRKKWQSQFTKA
jgi:hypothetical protein